MSRTLPTWAATWLALALSGVAGLVNQVVWQRALKIFLGGSETLSAMVVVLVFMLGLGLGAGGASRFAHRLRHPLRTLAGVELALALTTLAIAFLLAADVSESVYAVQRLALGAGVPLRVVYAVGALVLLLPPTVLMGATLPLASEAFQRQLEAEDSRLVPILFFVNTLGAAGGALATSMRLLPLLGQQNTLFVAVAANTSAAVLLALASLPLRAALPGPDAPSHATPIRLDEGLGFALGFVALAYEMLLFRVLVLAHEPLPTTFAVGLAAFLLAWSVGMAIAPLLPHVPTLAGITGLVVGAVPFLYALDLSAGYDLAPASLMYALPAVGFGMLYGVLVTRVATDWGRDVGRYAAFNTLGSCAGVLAATLVGLELPLTAGTTALALALLAVAAVDLSVRERHGATLRGVAASCIAMGAGVVAWGWSTPYTSTDAYRTYWGRDGVVEVTDDGQVFIDGLWHTKLTDGTDHIGRPYSWLMAATAVMALDRRPQRALVVGAGVGISSVTLEGFDGLQVDGYEINHTLQRVLRDYPDATLHALDTPRIRWIWQDARTGLALDETTYDIILSAPLHLRQAGSSLLLSTEYIRLAKSRLAPDGVLAVYSNEGSPAQSALIRRTLTDHFKHQVSWYDGVVTLASDHPIDFTEAGLRQRMQEPDRLFRELAALDARLKREGWDDGVFDWYDGPVTGALADRPIRDDQPLIEYPELADERIDVP